MPTVGPFHRFYWKARANPVAPPVRSRGGYPPWQASVTSALVFGWVPLDAIAPIWRQVRWLLHIARRLWPWRAPETQDRLETWIARIESFDAEQLAVLERVVAAMTGPHWPAAQQAVRTCATTPKFHAPEQWVVYSRELKANVGQAQNIFRHVKALSVLRPLGDGPAPLSNPEAHLLIELAYQAFAAMGRPDRQVVTH